MPVLQNLYQVYKISSTTIKNNNFVINNYTKKEAVKDGNLVSIGDNMVFYKIRDYYGDKRTHTEIFNKIQELRKTLRICKKQGKKDEARIVNQQIQDILFVKDIIVVTCEKKRDYRDVGTHQFIVNGIKFIRFCAGAGNLRRNCAIYVNENLYPYLYECFMCGLKDKIQEAVLPKLGAYFALSFSSLLWVRTPRCCVIKDYENIIPKQKVDYILRDGEKHYIEERIMDLTLNCADGQGLIDPQFSELWAQDMGLDYIPSSFVVRSSFVKGNLVPFDFKEYAKENNISTIKDRWGYEYKISDIDVLLSESQFKEYKEYSSWQEYLHYFEKYDLRWGVARYNKKYDDENVLANYQYIQSLELSQDEIYELIQPTIDWINKICSGEDLYSMLFMFGCKNEDVDYKRLYSGAQSTYTKAIIKNNDMLKDTYVQHKIYKNIIECINRAKIGKIWIKGNYQFMISDPIAQCRSALGLSIKGEVPAKCLWSNFWNERNITGYIDCCRSPQIDTSEHNPSLLYKSEETNRWYKYIKSGVVFSIYDTAVFKLSDADFDGDICMTTDNKYFIKGSHPWENIITYEKGIAVKEKISINNFIKKDLMGFGTAVGSFSNTATILYAMIGIFNKPEQEEQRKELKTRIKLLREYVGQEIDRAKLGIKKAKLPDVWKKRQHVNKDDPDEVKAEKYKQCSMVISKKPYFFRYLYPELNKQFKQFENNFNIIAKDTFGIKLKKLLVKKDKTQAEKTLVMQYQKYSPLIVSNCVMNILCKRIESIDFDIKFNKNNQCLLPRFNNCGYVLKTEILRIFRNSYRKYCNKKSIETLKLSFDDRNDQDVQEIYFGIMDYIKDEISESINELKLSPKENLFYIWKLSEEYSNFNWNFAWDIIPDDILECVPQGQTMVPIKDNNGQSYLGQKYSLKDITFYKNLDFDDLDENIDFNNLDDYYIGEEIDGEY